MKSASSSLTFALVVPGGTVAVQLPFASVTTVCIAPFASVITTFTFAMFGSPTCCVPLPFVST